MKLWQTKAILVKKASRFQKPIPFSQLSIDIIKSGLKGNDVVIVHSSLSKIGRIEGGAQAIISLLVEYFSQNGTLIMPSFSFRKTMIDTINDRDFVFDLDKSNSVVGILSETFRKYPGVKRSFHPTHSFCALGKDDSYIVEGQLDADTNFGKDTPMHRASLLKGKIVGIGIGIGPVTIYHSLEDLYPELFEGVYCEESYSLKIISESVIETKNIKIHNPSYHKKRIDKSKSIEEWFKSHFIKKGILHFSKFGRGEIWWMDIQELFDELLILKKKGITIYNTPEVETK